MSGLAKTTKKAKPMGPKTLTGSREAKRLATVLLEVLSGVRGPQAGADALAISLSRYYQLETRALQGLITALEPRPKGRQKSAADELETLRRDKRRLEQELLRSQALVRAGQRSLGLSASAGSKKRGKLAPNDGKARRRRRRVDRGATVVKADARSRRRASDSGSASPASTSCARRPSKGHLKASRRARRDDRRRRKPSSRPRSKPSSVRCRICGSTCRRLACGRSWP